MWIVLGDNLHMYHIMWGLSGENLHMYYKMWCIRRKLAYVLWMHEEYIDMQYKWIKTKFAIFKHMQRNKQCRKNRSCIFLNIRGKFNAKKTGYNLFVFSIVSYTRIKLYAAFIDVRQCTLVSGGISAEEPPDLRLDSRDLEVASTSAALANFAVRTRAPVLCAPSLIWCITCVSMCRRNRLSELVTWHRTFSWIIEFFNKYRGSVLILVRYGDGNICNRKSR